VDRALVEGDLADVYEAGTVQQTLDVPGWRAGPGRGMIRTVGGERPNSDDDVGDRVEGVRRRGGGHGATFELVNFGTMRTSEPGDDEPDVDEARLTKFGRLLCATSLDELSTLVSVLWGGMTLVQRRRPSIRYMLRHSATHARRHEVRPRITGRA
jgi:hypothetical protein